VSWVMEQVIIEYFELDKPEYLTRKPTPAEAAAIKKREDATAQTLAEATARDKHRAARIP